MDKETSSATIFISNLPFQATDAGIQTALRRIFSQFDDKIQKITTNVTKGIAWIKFTNSQAAEAACAIPTPELNKRKLRVVPDNRNQPEKVSTLPMEDCWFCLANPKFDFSQVIWASEENYVISSKGPITKNHLVISSVQHVPCLAKMESIDSNKVLDLLDSIKTKVLSENSSSSVIIYERWIKFPKDEANHMQIHFIPCELSQTQIDAALEKVKNLLAWGEVDDFDQVKKKTQDGKSNYVWMKFPHKFILFTDCKIPTNLPRDIICDVLECPNKKDWRNCQSDDDQLLNHQKHIQSLRDILR
jgi:RNA recognition motif-containing protein